MGSRLAQIQTSHKEMKASQKPFPIHPHLDLVHFRKVRNACIVFVEPPRTAQSILPPKNARMVRKGQLTHDL